MTDFKKEKGEKEELNVKEDGTHEKKVLPSRRKIIIETDGNNIWVVSAEVAGNVELYAIFRELLSAYEKRK